MVGGSSFGEVLALSTPDLTSMPASLDHVDAATPMQCWLVRVRGRVQGVGFRDACVRRARALGLHGWVRNRMDGSVETLLQGAADRLAEMRDWLRDGVPGARVDDLASTPVPPPFDAFDRFERLPTR
jgi:acylphosphatase